MANSVEERNNRVIEIMNRLYQKAATTEPSDDEEFSDKIEQLFSTNVWGFREVVLTITVAMLDKIDFPDFKASVDFYKYPCKICTDSQKMIYNKKISKNCKDFTLTFFAV